MFCSRIAGRKSRFTLAKNYEPRIWKAWAVMVVAACAAIHGQSSPRQTSDPAVAALGSGFVSDTARVNGATLHYVRGGAGPAIILLHGFPEDWYAYHRIMPQLAKQFTVVAVDLRGLGGSAATAGGYDAANMQKTWGANPIDDSNHVSFKFPNSPIFLTPQFLGDPEPMDNFVVPTRVWSDGTPDQM